MAETPELLDDLLRAGAPSGYEGAGRRRLARRRLLRLADHRRPRLLDRPDRRREAPLLAVVGHIDEIGLVVTHIDEKGFLYFSPIGGWDPQILVGQRVEVRGRDGPVPGVVGRKPIHLLEDEQRKKVVELNGMHIDIGAADRDEARELVRVGDPVVIAADPVRARRRPAGLALDRQPARRLRRPRGAAPRPRARRACRASFAAVAAVQEEIGSERRPHLGLRARARPGARRRRHPRHRRPRGRGEGARPPPARLRTGDRPRLDALAEGLRAARRDRRAAGSSTRRGLRARHAAPTPTRSRSRAPGSPPGWSRSPCATCTRRSRWSTSPTSRRRSS